MQAQDPSQRVGQWFLWVAWAMALGFAYWFFQGVLDKQHNPNQSPLTTASPDGRKTVALIANKQGHYVGTLLINGLPTAFMLDTGATTIAVPEAVAAQLGMKKGMVHTVDTANGTARAYTSHIDTLQLGEIELTDLPATIAPGMEGDEILLGMSALKHLEFVKRDKTLTLIQQL